MIGCHVFRQPNGLIAIWSSTVDDWVYVNLTDEEFIALRVQEATDDARRNAMQTLQSRIRNASELGAEERSMLERAMKEKQPCSSK